MGFKSVGYMVKLDDRSDRKTYFEEFALSQKAEKRNERGQNITKTELSLVNSVKGYLLH